VSYVTDGTSSEYVNYRPFINARLGERVHRRLLVVTPVDGRRSPSRILFERASVDVDFERVGRKNGAPND
jgi:hypothetical protein